MTSTNTGVVKFFNSTKGYGFITDKDTKTDVFVHISSTLDKIEDGDVVTYDIETGKRGLKAVNVRRIKTNDNKGQTGVTADSK